MRYVLEIRRKPGAEFGAAIGTFYRDDEVIGHGPMITGPRNKLDPTQYGSITPPGEWIPVETLEKRQHLRGGDPFSFSRIIPGGEQRTAHKKRTYDINRNDPFMVHYGGTSTGCPCFLPCWWEKGKDLYNEGFAGGLMIDIIDDPVVDLSEFAGEFEKYSEEMAKRG